MKDHTANIVAKRVAQIKELEKSIAFDEAQINKLREGIATKEREVTTLSEQVKQIGPAELSAEQVSRVLDAMYDEQGYQKFSYQPQFNLAVYTPTTEYLAYIYRLTNLIWLAQNFELDSIAVDSYLANSLPVLENGENGAELFRSESLGLVESYASLLLDIYAEKGKELPATQQLINQALESHSGGRTTSCHSKKSTKSVRSHDVIMLKGLRDVPLASRRAVPNGNCPDGARRTKNASWVLLALLAANGVQQAKAALP